MKERIRFIALTLTVTLCIAGCTKPRQELGAGAHHGVHEHPGANAQNAETDECTVVVSAADSMKYVSRTLSVGGDVLHPLVLTVDSLRSMQVHTISDFDVVCSTGATVNRHTSSKGVLLKEILEKAVIRQSNHKDRNFYIVARATDNYKATFSWAELFNSVTGDSVYVLFEENGHPIQTQGSMVLISTSDIKSGPRHVIWLQSIDVYKVSPRPVRVEGA